MRNRREAQCLDPVEIALLQECLDTLLKRNGVTRSSQEAEIMAAALFTAYGRGVADKKELMRLADIRPNVAA